MRPIRNLTLCLLPAALAAAAPPQRLSRVEYEDRVRAAWTGQILGTLMGFAFEHKAAAVEPVATLPAIYKDAPVDDDYFYELVALRAFEKHGTGLSVAQLGEQWKANNAGAWGSSKEARLLLQRGVQPPDTGHPRYNRMWFSIGPQFSGDLYGMVAPGLPNLAGRLARDLGHINGYAEGTDGGVFVAGLVSLAFVEKDAREVVRQAARLIHPRSPYRQAIDQVIQLAERGASPAGVADAVERRWHAEYPPTNNAVANGALVALSVWFGEGDFLQTLNHAFAAADYTDADCNAANAGAVVGALRGMRAIPAPLVEQLQDRIRGSAMGGVPVVPPVDESITEIARRIAALGVRFVKENGGKEEGGALIVPRGDVVTQPAELFSLGDLMRYWNPEWTLERAGFGGAIGGMQGLRGGSWIEEDGVLATYPRDEVRAMKLTRTATLSQSPKLTMEVGAGPGEAWRLDVHAGNRLLLTRVIEGGGKDRQWHTVVVPLQEFAGRKTHLRLFQRVLIPGRVSGNAYWRKITLE